jgi:uncharacterized protein
MIVYLFLLILEVITIIGLRDRFRKTSGIIFIISIAVHVFLSIWIWYFLLRITTWKGEFDETASIWLRMNLMGFITAVIVPRFVFCLLHFTGRLIKIRKKGYIRWLTDTGIIVSIFTLFVTGLGTFVGRFNFKTEEVTVRIKGLPAGLNGFKIVQLSDMHLAGFHKNMDRLGYAVEKVNELQPDLLINTGDFVSYGWREFGRCDTILLKLRSRFGNYAVLGNHDMGTYLPGSTEEERSANVEKMTGLIISSGHRLLIDESEIALINGTRVAFIGVTTSGRHPDIIHGDVMTAMLGADSADFKILLSHDPNQWEMDVAGKTDIDLTLSGHTHGMQIGIITRKFMWSPSKYFYPHWNGLFRQENQYQYVNRGLGLLAIPFRIWMPPEITVIRLEGN